MERPNDAVVANDGTVAVNEWLFAGDRAGTFYVIAPDGRVLIEQGVKANLFRCGITADGQVAWCNTCTSDHQPDADKLFIFSAHKASLIAKIEGRVDPEEIIASEHEVSIQIRGYCERYDYEGNLLNSDDVREAYYSYLLKTSPSELLKLARRIMYLDKLSDHHFQAVNSISLKIISDENIDDSYKAQAYRFLGELTHRSGDIKATIGHFRNALRLDPKVGVKTILSKLEKSSCALV